MRQAAKFLHVILCNLDVIVWAVDTEGTFTLLEGRALKAIGFTPGQVVGQSVFDVYRDRPDVCDYVQRALRGEEFVKDVVFGDVIVESQYAPLRGDDGQIVGAVGVSIDITSQRRANQDLLDRVELTEARLRAEAESPPPARSSCR